MGLSGTILALQSDAGDNLDVSTAGAAGGNVDKVN
jgi:hypothetical protein